MQPTSLIATTSIQRKYLKLANEQPGSGNPTMSRVTLLAKEIKEAINVKAGVSNPDLSDFFGDDFTADDDDDQDDITGLDGGGDNNPIPTSIEVASASVNPRASDPSVSSSAGNISSGGNNNNKKHAPIYWSQLWKIPPLELHLQCPPLCSSDNFLKQLSGGLEWWSMRMNAGGGKKKEKRYTEREKRLKKSVDANVTKIAGGGKKSCINSNSGKAISRNRLIG